MKKPRHFKFSALASIFALCATVPAWSAIGNAPKLSPRIRELVSKLTLDEKIALTVEARDPVSGAQAGYTPGVARLGVPAMRWTDGPGGVDNRYQTTSLPQPLALAATFDRKLFYAYGTVEGADTRATNMDVFLGPMADIARVPNGSRNISGHGEDPFLDAAIVDGQVRGIQSEGALAVTKHFIGYNQMTGVDSDRHQKRGNDFIIDERTLHEIYLPGFEAAVKANTAGIMAAYNSVNGAPNAGNSALLTGILRDELGFKGFTVSDWGANHSTDAIEKGLDVEFSGSGLGLPMPNYFGAALKRAIEGGTVPVSALDRAVGNVLTSMDSVGMLDNTRKAAPAGIDVTRESAIALEVSERAMVLLKNEGVLPLLPSRSVAMIGPTAGQLAAAPGFGSSDGFTARKVAPVDALRSQLSGGSLVDYAVGQDLEGVLVPASALTPASGSGHGLTRMPADGSQPMLDSSLDFTGNNAFLPGKEVRWSGHLMVPATGDYDIMIQGWGGGAELLIDGQSKARIGSSMFNFTPKRNSSLLPTKDNLDNGRVRLRLEAGKDYDLAVTMRGWGDQPVQIRLNWVTPEMRQAAIDRAVAAAQKADTAVVLVWQRAGEQADPEESLLLPNDQNELIEAVAAANPNTVVVMTSGPVQMPWLPKVKAVLEMWFPGQEGGVALANILTGKVNPSGRLPITFPIHMMDSPAYQPGHPERFIGVGGEVRYSEGTLVGYRWFDQQRITPLFAFGHGLSYTSFKYSNLRTGVGKNGADISFVVQNVGQRAGREVAQVYLGAGADGAVPMAPKSLSGFEAVDLAPMESKTVRIHVPVRQFSYWSSQSHGWKPLRGSRPVFVGASSRDIRLNGTVRFNP